MRLYLFLLMLPVFSFAQDKPAYTIFSREGKSIAYNKMIRQLVKADIVLFGELHDNAIDHWLELQVVKDLYALQPDLALGFEMFEADDQIVLTEYLQGVIEERHLLHEAKVWDNYQNDYKPLIEFARQHQVPAIATNIPRRYANLVYRKGIDALGSLPLEARRWMMPLPVDIDLSLPGYKAMLNIGMGGHAQNAAGTGENMARSQAVKDATMAHFILANPRKLFVHFHGAYHSRNGEGIVWYLKKANANIRIATIDSVEQEKIDSLDEGNRGAADFIICIPEDMTKTY